MAPGTQTRLPPAAISIWSNRKRGNGGFIASMMHYSDYDGRSSAWLSTSAAPPVSFCGQHIAQHQPLDASCRRRSRIGREPPDSPARFQLAKKSAQCRPVVDIIPGIELSDRKTEGVGALPCLHRNRGRAPRDILEQVDVGRLHTDDIVAAV